MKKKSITERLSYFINIILLYLVCTIFNILIPTTVNANSYLSGKMVIDNVFITGNLGNTITTLHNPIGDITELTISEGVLNNADVYWLRDNLQNLENLTIYGKANYSINGTLPENAFLNFTNLKTVNIATATHIGESAFEGCNHLIDAAIYAAVSLSNRAFANCEALVKIWTYISTPPSVGTETFLNCPANREIFVSSGTQAAFQAIDDGDTADNYWYGWKIGIGHGTIIQVNTDHGGNINWGPLNSEDSIYENVNGAIFWDGTDWTVNDTYGHMYFKDLRDGSRIGKYGPEHIIPAQEGSDSIGGYIFWVEKYNYSTLANDSGTYSYTGLKYSIGQPDGTLIQLLSRGNGNGVNSAYFDVIIEDTGPGLTTIREGGIICDNSGQTHNQAIASPLISSLILGQLITSDFTNNYNMYYIDINGGSEMGGMSYILSSIQPPEPKVIQAYPQAQTYISSFAVHFKNSEGFLEKFTFTPLLYNESYAAPPPSDIATLDGIKIDGIILNEFDTTQREYNIVLPSDTVAIPQVTASPTDSFAIVNITQASTLPGAATIVVTSKDKTHTIIYTINFTIVTNTKIYKFEEQNRIKLYPNPVSKTLTIHFENEWHFKNLNIIDTQGKVVISQSHLPGKTVDVSKLVPGIYYLVIKTKDQIIASKFMKK